MKQTAVDFIEDQIKNSKYYFELMKDINSRSTIAQPNIFEQAREMEKEQMVETWHNGYNNQSPMIDEENCGQQYYNETFNK